MSLFDTSSVAATAPEGPVSDTFDASIVPWRMGSENTTTIACSRKTAVAAAAGVEDDTAGGYVSRSTSPRLRSADTVTLRDATPDAIGSENRSWYVPGGTAGNVKIPSTPLSAYSRRSSASTSSATIPTPARLPGSITRPLSAYAGPSTIRSCAISPGFSAPPPAPFTAVFRGSVTVTV